MLAYLLVDHKTMEIGVAFRFVVNIKHKFELRNRDTFISFTYLIESIRDFSLPLRCTSGISSFGMYSHTNLHRITCQESECCTHTLYVSHEYFLRKITIYWTSERIYEVMESVFAKTRLKYNVLFRKHQAMKLDG